jgi:membrane associated rhomboid family serine protease
MFGLIEGIFSFVFGMIEMAFSLAWGAISFVFGLLGGIFSLLLSLGGFFLAGALVLVAIFRRREYKQKHQAASDNAQRVYDVDEEEFTSFYDQFRTGEQE